MNHVYIRSAYGVPARAGVRVEYTGGKRPRLGTITGAQGAYLLIILDRETDALPYHPTWEIRYLDETQALKGQQNGK